MAKLITAPLVFLILHLTVAPSAHAMLNVWLNDCNNSAGNYTTTSPYKTNLESIFTKTTTANLNYGFYNFSVGQAPDEVNLISLCVGNVDIKGCHACQNVLIGNMTNQCPNQKEAISWSDDCMVRYSNQPVLGVLAVNPGVILLRNKKASDEKYSVVVNTLLDSLPGNASAGDSRLKFAAAQVAYNSSVTIYAAAQCTPDLTQKDCLNCLNTANSAIQTCSDCHGQRGARILLPSCFLRFEEGKFYLDAPVTSPGPSTSFAPSTSPGPSTSSVPTTSPGSSTTPEPSTTPAPTTSPGSSTTPEPSTTPAPTTSPTSSGSTPALTTSPTSPSGNGKSTNTVNEAKGRSGGRSLLAIAIVGATFSVLL